MEESLLRRAALNARSMAMGYVATFVVGGLAGILIPRALGLENYGSYSAVLAVLGILGVVAGLGLQSVGVRFLSPLWARDRVGFSSLASTIWTIQLVLAPVMGVVAFLWLVGSIGSTLPRTLLVGAGVLCTFQILQEATATLFLPADNIGKMVGFEFARVALRLPAVVGGYLALGLAGAFAALAGTQVLLWAWAQWALSRIVVVSPGRFRWSVIKPHLSFAFWSYFDLAGSRSYMQFSIVALALWSTTSDAGILAISMQFYVMVRSLASALLRSVQPLLAEMEDAGDRTRMRAWSNQFIGLGLSVAMLIAALWGVAGSAFLDLILGSPFQPAFSVAMVLLCSLVPFVGAQVCHSLLYITNHPKAGALSSVAHSALGIVGFYIVLGQLRGGNGPMRVAWLFLVAALAYFALAAITLGRLTGLWLSIRRIALAMVPLPAVSALGLVPEGAKEFWVVPTLGAIFAGTYLAVILFARRDQWN